MDEDRSQERKRTWFIWGMVLAGVPSVALIIGLFHAFAGISEQKATGLAAVAGGIAEAYVTVGLVLTFMIPVAAIVLLGRSFSSGHGIRALFAALAICWSGLLLSLYGFAAWMFFVYLPRHGAGPR
ncbi:MAG: hypothetical protein DMG70_15295 [Acidobacteria bacterium]|nr:MAG: hypothetical protein DMG70_15295 [Acidobacteriota bacterium]